MKPVLYPDMGRLKAATLYLWEWLCRLDEIQKAHLLIENACYLLEEDADIRDASRRSAGMLSHCASPEAYARHYKTQWEATVPETVDHIRAAAEYFPRSIWALQHMQHVGVRHCIDLGAGNGAFALFFALHGIETVGVNLTEEAVRNSESVARRLHLPARFQLGHAEEVRPEDRGRYDAVCAFEILEHVRNDTTLIETMRSLAKPGGLLLLTTPVGSITYGQDIWSHLDGPPDTPQAHVRAYTEKRLRCLLADLCDVEVTRQPAMRTTPNLLCFHVTARNP